MITDPIFYRLFETSPETFFLLLGLSADAARDMAARYQYQALEFKETAHRADGVFLPREPGLPLYFLEVQFYRLPSVYADLLAKVYTYLKQHEPGQLFCGVVLFADPSLEPAELAPYQALLDAGLIRRFYLDEMPELANAPLGLAILYLIRQAESEAPAKARDLIVRAKTEVGDEALRANLIELIETVILYKLPRLTREEIQAMLQIHDIRESRVYQEAREEGKQEGLKEGKQEGLKEGKEAGLKEGIATVIGRLAAKNMSAAEIAALLELDVTLVQQALATANGN
jgi:predicted transposase/invertase (TIGR01784 family)